MADQISDSVLDAILEEDPNGRVACETLLTTGLVVRRRRDLDDAYVDIPRIVRRDDLRDRLRPGGPTASTATPAA